MKWFKRKIKEPMILRVAHTPVTVHHQIQKEPDPKPTTIWLTISDNNGQSYRTVPVRPYGRETMMQSFPLSWITGNADDNHQQVRVDIGMDYE